MRRTIPTFAEEIANHCVYRRARLGRGEADGPGGPAAGAGGCGGGPWGQQRPPPAAESWAGLSLRLVRVRAAARDHRCDAAGCDVAGPPDHRREADLPECAGHLGAEGRAGVDELHRWQRAQFYCAGEAAPERGRPGPAAVARAAPGVGPPAARRPHPPSQGRASAQRREEVLKTH